MRYWDYEAEVSVIVAFFKERENILLRLLCRTRREALFIADLFVPAQTFASSFRTS